VWLVDAVIAGAPAGTIHRRGHDEVLGVAQRHATAHALSLPECLRWLVVAYPEMARCATGCGESRPAGSRSRRG